MNQEIAMRWADALESGEYLQGVGRLKRQRNSDETATFCCLGVLCDISGVGEWRMSDGQGVAYFVESDEPNLGMPPNRIADWAGIQGSWVARNVPLIVLNDGSEGGERHTFPQIAALIRQCWEEM